MKIGSRCRGLLGLRQYARIRLLHHLLAEVHADQVVLKDVVIEHVFGGLTEIYDPLRDCRWAYVERHVLCVRGASRVVVTANPADAVVIKCASRGSFPFMKMLYP